MSDYEMPAIVCDVELPRDSKNTYAPTVWIEDNEIDFDSKGIILRVATYPTGTVVSGAELSRGWAEGDSPAAVVAELVEAGYLLPDGPNRFRLVHPARLGPLPTA